MHLQRFKKIMKRGAVLVMALSLVLVGCGQSGENGEGQTQMQGETSGQQMSQSEQARQAQMKQRMQQQMQQQMQSPDIEVSEKELKKFANVLEEAQQIQQGQRKKMKSAVEETGISLNRYSQIMRQMQRSRGDTSQSVDMTSEERQQIQDANKAVQSIQSKTQQKITQAIEDEGMQPQRFQKILQAVRTDTSLQKRFRSYHQ